MFSMLAAFDCRVYLVCSALCCLLSVCSVWLEHFSDSSALLSLPLGFVGGCFGITLDPKRPMNRIYNMAVR